MHSIQLHNIASLPFIQQGVGFQSSRPEFLKKVYIPGLITMPYSIRSTFWSNKLNESIPLKLIRMVRNLWTKIKTAENILALNV